MPEPPADYLGKTHEPAPDARVLSLVPSLTELMFDLGLAENLVGRTHYCIHPADRIGVVPSVGGTKKIKMNRVRELAPTHALVNVDENPREMADDLRRMGIDVIVTHPMHPDDNQSLYALIGHVFGADAAAAELAARYRSAREAFDTNGNYPPLNAVYLIWKNPWMAIDADTYIARTLGLVNWRVVTPGADPTLEGDAARYPEVALDDLSLKDVDLVLFSSEPYTFTERHLDEFRQAFPDHAGKAHLIDGEMTSWYGSRAIQGLTYLRNFCRTIVP
jgi:ABC-type Fe3+-hydroxamate transport system substrate-binding protein